jgi:hypothetical protein
VPVTLKRFLALELVFTFGMFFTTFNYDTLLAVSNVRNTYGALWAIQLDIDIPIGLQKYKKKRFEKQIFKQLKQNMPFPCQFFVKNDRILIVKTLKKTLMYSFEQ